MEGQRSMKFPIKYKIKYLQKKTHNYYPVILSVQLLMLPSSEQAVCRLFIGTESKGTSLIRLNLMSRNLKLKMEIITVWKLKPVVCRYMCVLTLESLATSGIKGSVCLGTQGFIQTIQHDLSSFS